MRRSSATMGEPLLPYETLLWAARLVLLASVVLHIVAAVELTRMNWAARPRGYETKRSIATSYAALTMRYSGVILALFVVYHLLHLTVGVVGFQAGQLRTPQGVQQRGGRRSRSGMCRSFTSWRWPPCACTWTTGSGACSRRSA